MLSFEVAEVKCGLLTNFEPKIRLPGQLERETGLEPATPCSEGRNSTTELLPRDRIYFTSNVIVGKQEEGFVFTM